MAWAPYLERTVLSGPAKQTVDAEADADHDALPEQSAL